MMMVAAVHRAWVLSIRAFTGPTGRPASAERAPRVRVNVILIRIFRSLRLWYPAYGVEPDNAA